MPSNGNIHLGRDQVAGDFHRQLVPAFFVIHVMDVTAFLAKKVAMFLHVGTIARGSAFDVDLLDEAAFHQRVQGIVNSCDGNFRHVCLGPQIYVIRSGVVRLVQQGAIHMFTLRRHPHPAVSQFARQIVVFLCRRLFLFHLAERKVAAL